MKKSVLIVSLLFLSLLSVQLIFAQPNVDPSFTNAIKDIYNNLAEFLDPILTYVLGGVEPSQNSSLDPSDLFLIKILIFILIISFVYSATQKVPIIEESASLSWIVTIIVSILSTRFLTTEALVTLVWLPNGALGITLTVIFPFIIFFLFIESFDYSFIRKFGWIVFTFIFFSLASTRWSELQTPNFNLGWIYVGAAILSLLFIIFDKQVKARTMLSNLRIRTNKANLKHVSRLLDEIDEWAKVASNMSLSQNDRNAAEKKIRDAQNAIANLRSN